MAFISEEARHPTFQGDKRAMAQEHIGPGTYEPLGQKKILNNLAPFNQRAKRESPDALTAGGNKGQPGPGDYQLEHHHISQKTNLIKRMKVNSNALSQPGFTSSVVRLPLEHNTRNDSSAVGPGSYNLYITPVNSKKIAQPKSLAGRHAATSPTGTTSPTPGSLSYIPSVGSTQKVGPGSYQMNILNSKKEKGGYVKDWSLEKPNRFQKNEKTSINGKYQQVIGPGYYDVQHKPYSQVSQHQISRSAAFASESKRVLPEFDNQIKSQLSALETLDQGVKKAANQSITRNPSLGMFRSGFEPKGPLSMAEELLAEENQKKITPGPGHYVAHEHKSAFLLKQSPPVSQQTFGFSNHRFEPNTYTEEMHLDRVRGPGLYHNDSLPIKKRNFSQAGFASSAKRDSQFGQASGSAYLGPGQYEERKMGNGIPTYNKLAGKKSFGMQKRFTTLKVGQQPGPTDYMPDRSLELLKNKKAQVDSQSSMFANAEPRMHVPPSITPAPGVYDSQNSLAGNLEVRSKTQLKAPKKLRSSASQQITKSLAGARFDGHLPKHEVGTFQKFVDSCRGPGSYEADPTAYNKTTAVSPTAILGQGSPNRPRGLVKAGRMLVGSESDPKVGNISRNQAVAQGTFTLEPKKLVNDVSRNTNPGPGEYEVSIQRSLGANKSFNLKYL